MIIDDDDNIYVLYHRNVNGHIQKINSNGEIIKTNEFNRSYDFYIGTSRNNIIYAIGKRSRDDLVIKIDNELNEISSSTGLLSGALDIGVDSKGNAFVLYRERVDKIDFNGVWKWYKDLNGISILINEFDDIYVNGGSDIYCIDEDKKRNF